MSDIPEISDELREALYAQFDAAFRKQLEAERCPRCDISTRTSLLHPRCFVCGMEPSIEGPAPRRIMKGIAL